MSTRELLADTLDRIAAQNKRLNAFVDITGKRALAEADALDNMRRHGESLPALAAVPYTVKNLFDVQGVTTKNVCTVGLRMGKNWIHFCA